VTLSAGYLTVDTGEYHFHLHIGVPEGAWINQRFGAGATAERSPERCSSAKHARGKGCLPGSWGFRMWNGIGEQMITIYFPNPYYDKQGMLKEPQLDRLRLWEGLRDQYAIATKPSNA
jgi:hypothetical protein